MTETRWSAWHRDYDEPGSYIDLRLQVVRRRTRAALDHAPPGPIRVISMCAGQGRDLLGVLPEHPRRADVTARLVELDPGNVESARTSASATGLSGVEVSTADAGTTTAYDGIAPAEVVLACGVFGNVGAADIERTVGELPRLCTVGGTVIWTRHRFEPDATPAIRRWFERAGFVEVGFDTVEGTAFGVGTHRLVEKSKEYEPGIDLFRFLR